MSHNINVTRIKAVSNALSDIKDQVVFVGGATVSLYATRPAFEVRPTDDVDVVVEIASYIKYTELEAYLRTLGFENDQSVIGRFLFGKLIIDIMPTDDKILGFTNIWYKEGFKYSSDYLIYPQHSVKIFSPPYFIASKFEALKDRKPKDDPRASRDLEDIVFVLENRKSIWEEMNNAENEVKKYLVAEFTNLYNNPYCEELIDAHVTIKSPSSAYFIMEDMENFIK